ncbi:hypothetical protein ACFY1L_33670 [Streptomyces sp. NPDC001663]|uniref:hypothetical protein n=1 Tax=Streptomyces sp. NPDC001663 TaxID=3364597 RepID=UPI0036822DFA
MITHSDEGPDFDPDDPLTVILRPPAEYLGAPPGHYEAIRRGAARRRLLRAAVGAAVTCGVAALVVLPLRLTASDAPGTPAVPMAPPPASSPTASPHRPATPEPSEPRPTPTAVPTQSSSSTRAPSAALSQSPTDSRAETSVPSTAPSAADAATEATPSSR